MFGKGKETGRLLDKLSFALVRDSRICYQQPRGWISRLPFGWRSVISCTSPSEPLRTRRFTKLLPKTVRSTAKTCCLARKAFSSAFLLFSLHEYVVSYSSAASRLITLAAAIVLQPVVASSSCSSFKVFQLGADTSCLKPPALLSVKGTCWLSNEKRRIFEVCKMDELDFGAEIWAIQLPCKIKWLVF